MWKWLIDKLIRVEARLARAMIHRELTRADTETAIQFAYRAKRYLNNEILIDMKCPMVAVVYVRTGIPCICLHDKTFNRVYFVEAFI